jgi:hypothetical protein
MDERATSASWKTEPMGERRLRLPLTFVLDKSEMDIVSMGTIPESMEDKWFCYLEDGRLHFHRSWTGYEIYEIRFEQEGGRHIAREVWVTRDPDRYRWEDGPAGQARDVEFLIQMMDWMFGIRVRPGEAH